MDTQANKALLFGASGLVGSQLLDLLLEDGKYAQVIAYVRNPLPKQHPKLQTIPFDYVNWNDIEDHFTPNAHIFCCVGTTMAKTPDKEIYRGIDFGIPMKLAEYAARGSSRGLYIISSMGANPHSRNFYQKTKGEMEEAVKKKHVRETYFFRPSLLLGERKEHRLGENIGKVMNAVLGPLLFGSLKKYRGIPASVVAKAIKQVAEDGYSHQVIENDMIFKLGGEEN